MNYLCMCSNEGIAWHGVFLLVDSSLSLDTLKSSFFITLAARYIHKSCHSIPLRPSTTHLSQP
jgi:hypothetical protein